MPSAGHTSDPVAPAVPSVPTAPEVGPLALEPPEFPAAPLSLPLELDSLMAAGMSEHDAISALEDALQVRRTTYEMAVVQD